MAVDAVRSLVEGTLADADGILRLELAWVARDFLRAGRRLGLPQDAYVPGSDPSSRLPIAVDIREGWGPTSTSISRSKPHPCSPRTIESSPAGCRILTTLRRA